LWDGQRVLQLAHRRRQALLVALALAQLVVEKPDAEVVQGQLRPHSRHAAPFLGRDLRNTCSRGGADVQHGSAQQTRPRLRRQQSGVGQLAGHARFRAILSLA
jgi:hypothetical protein